MASVKAFMQCMGLDTSSAVSILSGFFGFAQDRVPADPCSGAAGQVRVLEQIQSLQGRHFHLNVIRVGVDNFTGGDFEIIDSSLLRLRQIYRQADLGVGRIQHWDITAAQSNGRNNIGSRDETEDLAAEWTVPNFAIDAFVVESIAGFLGRSPVNGPCDKDSKEYNGLVVGLIGDGVVRTADGLARTLAHEVGHYLGLSHNHDDDECPGSAAGLRNLMAQTGCVANACTDVELDGFQQTFASLHCFVRGGC